MDESNLKEIYEAISKRMSVREYGEEIVKPELCDKKLMHLLKKLIKKKIFSNLKPDFY
jgi:hypothetical protein